MTCRFIIIVGGEPLLEKDALLKLFTKHPRMPFLVATNGKLLDEPFAEKVATLGNILTFINIPGLEPTAKAIRRDPDVWNDICRAAKNLKKYGAASGFVSTVYPTNFRDVSSQEFVQQMIDFKMMLGFYFGYSDPVGCPPRKGLALNPAMKDEFSGRVQSISATKPLILINTIGAENKIGGCASGKARMIYIQSDGNVGGCPMVPQLDGELNIHQKSLTEILKHPYFQLIRREKPICLREPNFLAKLQKVSTAKQ